MIEIRKAGERGHFNFGWLDTWHSFSFGHYRDPKQQGFSDLLVINDDMVQPGMGFGTHPHRDMEIFTYILSGALEHKDSMGTGSIIRPGDALDPDRRRRGANNVKTFFCEPKRDTETNAAGSTGNQRDSPFGHRLRAQSERACFCFSHLCPPPPPAQRQNRPRCPRRNPRRRHQCA